MKKIINKIFTLASLFVLMLCAAYTAYATGSVVPTGPDTLTTVSSGRFGEIATKSLNAEAGNVTEISLSHRRVTEAWQGYYGNISGMITLDDASNYTMYDWQLPSPTGEVYASNGSSVTWANIKCINFSSNLTDGWAMNETTLEDAFKINVTDLDGFDETFNSTYTNATGFQVGGIQINTQDGCHQAYTYVDQAYQTNNFKEVLLTDDSSIVFTALLENSLDGFKTRSDPHDFQMLVAENGHPGFESTTTTYYFFVELS